MFFICSIVINIRCPSCTWPYSCIWLCNIKLFGARTRHIRIMCIVRLGYHGSTETIREAAKNNEESISERIVQVIEGERENTRPQKIRNKEKRPKTRRTSATPPRMKKEKSPTPKREEGKQRNSKRKKKAWKEKKKEVTQLNSPPKKNAWRKEKE